MRVDAMLQSVIRSDPGLSPPCSGSDPHQAQRKRRGARVRFRAASWPSDATIRAFGKAARLRHRSITRSPEGRLQQISAVPSAGGSIGVGR